MSDPDVLIDATRLLDRALRGRLPTGVDRVSLEYVRHFRERAHALVRFGGRWVELPAADSRRVFEALLEQDPALHHAIRWCVAKAYASSLPRRHGACLLLNTGHSGLEGEDYARQVRRYGLQPLFFLHDLIPITHPEYCRPRESEKHHRRLGTMLDVGCGVIVNSEATARGLEEYAARRHQRMPPWTVAPLAPGRMPPAAPRPIDAPYFVMLGTIEPRKNHSMLLQVWRRLVERLGAQAPRLVVIGQRGWECENVVDLLERCEPLRGFVIERSQCPDVELASYLQHAAALLFPSFVEGYGLPLVEALGVGTPVIASDLQVFREIAGDVPDYADPLDGRRWAQLVTEFAATGSSLRQAQLVRIARFKVPTWSDHFARVDELLARAAATWARAS